MTSPAGPPLRGAIDLAALSTAREAEARRSQAMVNAPDGVVIDVTEETFPAEVIERSASVPVIVDLWASWCGPCKTLSPILETLAAEYGGRFILAKVDVDAQPRIAAIFQVQSIPSVFAIIGGQPVPLFQGALPEPQVRAYLDEVLKVAAENGVSGTLTGEPVEEPAEPPEDPRFSAAFDAIEAGDWAGAAQAYRNVLVESPNDPDARAGLALCELQMRVDEPAPTDDFGLQLRQADLEAIDGQWADAFERLIDVVRRSAGAERDTARERLLDLFATAGDDPAVAAARIALSNALF